LLGHWAPEVTDIEESALGLSMSPPYTEHRHTSTLYADRAIQYLDSHTRQGDRPFFMYVAFNAPHDPRQSPQSFVDLYPLDSLETPPSFLPEHPFDQGERNTLRDELLAPFPRTEEAVKTHMQEYYAIISHMDYELGRILDHLDALGLTENTYIFFTADHGLAVGRHGLMGKQNQYDHSIRVPLIVKGPGIQAGAHTDALVYLQSIYPTSLELAGVSIPQTVEFRSLAASLRQPGDESAVPTIFGSYKEFQRMARTSDHKLIVYPEAHQIQLFDIRQDPLEMHNLAHDPAYRDTAEALYRQLKQLQVEVGDTLTLPASVFDM
jgi:choline-sulfatase